MKGVAIPYSLEERAFLSKNRTLTRRELHAAFVETFSRDDVSLANLTALCKREKWLTGRNGRYLKGAVPMNKGKAMPYNAAFAAHRFPKGNLPHNTKYLGHERLAKDGYIEVSVEKRNPHTGFERSYVRKHVWLWEQAHGKIPDGMCLKCLDGNKLNTDPSNWQAIPRALLPRLNGRFGRGYDAAPAEIKPVILATAKLEHALRDVQEKA